MTADNWKPTLASILSGYDWDKVVADVRPFLEKQTDLDLLTKDNLLALLQTRPWRDILRLYPSPVKPHFTRDPPILALDESAHAPYDTPRNGPQIGR
jgi:hypothetical protein